MSECRHIWISNSGRGGDPVFKKHLGRRKMMHARCSKCGDRSWFDEIEWMYLGRLDATGVVKS